MPVKLLFRNLKPGEVRILIRPRKICEVRVFIIGQKLPTGEYIFYVKYAADEVRALSVEINDQLFTHNACSKKTGGLGFEYQK